MATLRIRANELSGRTGLTVRLYAEGGSLIVNGAGGDALSETADSDGEFTATVAEALTGKHRYYIYQSGGSIFKGKVYCAGSIWIADVDMSPEDLDAIELLLTAGQIEWTAVVSAAGTISGSIVIGDSYLTSSANSFIWYLDPPAGLDVADFSGSFKGWFHDRTRPSEWASTCVITEVTVSGDPKWKLEFELDNDQTDLLRSGQHFWSVALVDSSGNRSTRKLGTVSVSCGGPA